MKKLFKGLLAFLIVCLAISVLFSILCSIIGLTCTSSEGSIFNIFWPVFRVVFIITFLLFMAVFLGLCLVVLADKKERKKEKDKIISAFSLKKETYTEVKINLIDLPHNREFLLKIIRSLPDTPDDSFNTFSTTFMGRRISLPLNENTTTTQTLIKVLEDFGCKYYIHLDKKENISWCIKSPKDDILYSSDITDITILKENFKPKL